MGYIVRCIQHGYYEKPVVAVVDGSCEKAAVINSLRDKAHNEATKRRVWESTKEKEDFNVFLAYIKEEKNLDFIELNEILSPEEAVEEYVEWVKAGRPKISI